MARNKEGKQPLCPLEYGLDIFNGKWKTRIICLLGRALLPPAGRIPAPLQKGRGLPSVKKQGRYPAPFRICPFPGFF